jgi:hypothetical protein
VYVSAQSLDFFDLAEKRLISDLETASAHLFISGWALANGRGLTKMTLLHGHSSTTGTDIFHRCQFILAYMAGINLGCATKTALARISTGVAQMSRLIRYRATIFTAICHDSTPFSRKAISVQAKRGDFITT